MFHQKQYKNYCRCHAINNLIGSNILSFTQFDKYCDEFDILNNMPLISKDGHYFYNNGGNNNIFGYIFNKLNYKIKLTTYFLVTNKTDVTRIELINTMLKNVNIIKGFLIFNNNHTWCIRKVNDKFYLIDSLKWMVTILNNEKLSKYLISCKGIILGT